MEQRTSASGYAGAFAITAIIFAILLVILDSLTWAFITSGATLAIVALNIGGEDDDFLSLMLFLSGVMALVGGIGSRLNWW